MGATVVWVLPTEFVQRLITLRKARGLSQEALADAIDLRVNQIKRYEAGTAYPTLDTLVRLATALHTTLDDLVFGEDQRGPSEDHNLQFEALNEFDDEDCKITKVLLESLILKHNASRAFAS